MLKLYQQLNKSSLLRFNEREILDFFDDSSSYNIKVGFNVFSRTNIKLPKININDSLEKKKVRSKYVFAPFEGRKYNKKRVSKLPYINKYQQTKISFILLPSGS